MAFFRRNKVKKKSKPAPPSELKKTGPQQGAAIESADSRPGRDDPHETSPQRVGIVSGILSTSAESDGLSQYGNVVESRFGPDPLRTLEPKKQVAGDGDGNSFRDGFVEHEGLRPVVDEAAESPKLEVDPMAHIGHATTITGHIVAEEDLEIQGTIEGSVRLANHRLIVGSDGLVKATVEAHTVLVIGKISGNVVATELVEIKAGGVIGGDVKAPRVIMNDGAIVVGALDMSAALPSSARGTAAEPPAPARPRLMRVELPTDDPSSRKNRF